MLISINNHNGNVVIKVFSHAYGGGTGHQMTLQELKILDDTHNCACVCVLVYITLCGPNVLTKAEDFRWCSESCVCVCAGLYNLMRTKCL